MRRAFVLIAVAVAVAWAGHETVAQVIRTAPIGGGVRVGPVGGGIPQLPPLPPPTLTPPNLGGSTLPLPEVHPFPQSASPSVSVGAGATADDNQSSQYRPVQTSPSQHNGENNSSYNVSAAGGGGPPPEAGGDDDDDDDDDDDAGDNSAQEDDDEDDDDERKINWWIWGPVAFVGFIVVVSLFNRG